MGIAKTNKTPGSLYFMKGARCPSRYKTKIAALIKKISAINLKGAACERCGHQSPYWENFEFHHKKKFNPNKDARMGSLWSSPWERILVELDKCELLCCNCHKIHHRILNSRGWIKNLQDFYGVDINQHLESIYPLHKKRGANPHY